MRSHTLLLLAGIVLLETARATPTSTRPGLGLESASGQGQSGLQQGQGSRIKTPEVEVKTPTTSSKTPEVPPKTQALPSKTPELSSKTPEVPPTTQGLPSKTPGVPTRRPELGLKTPTPPSRTGEIAPLAPGGRSRTQGMRPRPRHLEPTIGDLLGVYLLPLGGSRLAPPPFDRDAFGGPFGGPFAVPYGAFGAFPPPQGPYAIPPYLQGYQEPANHHYRYNQPKFPGWMAELEPTATAYNGIDTQNQLTTLNNLPSILTSLLQRIGLRGFGQRLRDWLQSLPNAVARPDTTAMRGLPSNPQGMKGTPTNPAPSAVQESSMSSASNAGQNDLLLMQEDEKVDEMEVYHSVLSNQDAYPAPIAGWSTVVRPHAPMP